jgi:cell division protein FtsQ
VVEPTPVAQEAQAEPAPRLLRLRTFTGLLLLGAMVGSIWAFSYWEPRLLPVRIIEVQGELHHHSSELLRETLVKRLQGGFLTADLSDLKQAAEELAWVGGASIRRVWPDRLQVRVVEHRPVARWKGDGLVTAEGIVFRPRGVIPAGLPMLVGDEQRSRELVQRYLKWRDSLMMAGQLIDTVSVDARGAWSLDLVSGMRLELGTDDIEQRLTRFIAAAPQLEAAGRARVVDLRYSNGFAVKWATSAATPSPDQALPRQQAQKQKAAVDKKKGLKLKTTAKESLVQRQAQPKTPAPKPRSAVRLPAASTKAQVLRQLPTPRPSPAMARAPSRALTQAAQVRP